MFIYDNLLLHQVPLRSLCFLKKAGIGKPICFLALSLDLSTKTLTVHVPLSLALSLINI